MHGFELGLKTLEIRGFYMDLCKNWQKSGYLEFLEDFVRILQGFFGFLTTL